MTSENLEELKPAEEGAEPTPGAEEKKPTPPEAEPTLGKTYDQKQLDEAVGKGVSSIQSQLTLSKAEGDKVKANLDALTQEHQDLIRTVEALEEKQFADDPDELERHRKGKADNARTKALDTREAKIEEDRIVAENERWANKMEAEFGKASKEYEVPYEAVANCPNVDSLWTIARLFPKVEPEQPAKPTKVDSGLGGGGGGLSDSPEDKVTRGLEKLKKK